MDRRPKPRWLQYLWAKLWGYPWKPCALCGEYFGGHEVGATVYAAWDIERQDVCQNCTDKAIELSGRNRFREIRRTEAIWSGEEKP